MDPRTHNPARRHRRHGLRQRAGFTLIELLTVIGILGLLLGILALTVTSVRVRTRAQKTQFVIRQLEGAISIYHNERGEYPPSEKVGGYTGSQSLVQALTGYQDEAGDGKAGWGFRDIARGKVFGPYNDTERLKTVNHEFMDAFDRPILYYRYDRDDGYLAGHNNDGPADLSAYLRGPGNEYFRKDFVLISRGPDQNYDQIPYIQSTGWNRNCDDITNFMKQ